MSNGQQNCSQSSDCTIERENGIDTTRFCFEIMFETTDKFFCDCSPHYGYTGDKCDEVSFQTVWFGIMTLLLLISGIVSLIYIFYIIKQQKKTVGKVLKRVEKGQAKKTLVYLLIIMFIETIFEIMAFVLEFSIILNSQSTTLSEYNSPPNSGFSGNTIQIVSPPGESLHLIFFFFSLEVHGLTTIIVVIS